MAIDLTITCVECGAEHRTNRRNTKRCHICRLRNNLLHIGTRVRACVKCGERFSFTRKEEGLCPKCDHTIGRMTRGTCGVCDSPNAPLPIPNLRLCNDCLHEPKRRIAVLDALRQRIQWEQRRNGVMA